MTRDEAIEETAIIASRIAVTFKVAVYEPLRDDFPADPEWRADASHEGPVLRAWVWQHGRTWHSRIATFTNVVDAMDRPGLPGRLRLDGATVIECRSDKLRQIWDVADRAVYALRSVGAPGPFQL